MSYEFEVCVTLPFIWSFISLFSSPADHRSSIDRRTAVHPLPDRDLLFLLTLPSDFILFGSWTLPVHVL